MLPPYAKRHLSFADQVKLLQQRGLEITNTWQAERNLARTQAVTGTYLSPRPETIQNPPHFTFL